MDLTLSEQRREALRALCDTVVAPVARDSDPCGLWARSASDVGVPAALEGLLSTFPPEQAAGVGTLLDVLALSGITRGSQRSREQILRNMLLVGGEAGAGVGALQSLVLYLAYGLPDERGQNPFWPALGYPGPISAPPPAAKPLRPLDVGEAGLELEADVCVVGSGAGGGVIAGVLAQTGARVVVLEAGEYLDESDFAMLELPAFQRSYWRGGPTPTADGNVTLQAGFGLGGGTTINWTNCLRTRPWVREQWAREHGLDGVDGPDFDSHLDAVLSRIGATDRCSDLNGPQQRMREGAEALGWSFATVVRNTLLERYDPTSAGYMGFGDQSGAKLGTLKTYLQDASDAGAQILVRTWAQRVLTEGGRASGVEAVAMGADGSTAPVSIRAPHVVVAAGALESPALLLRSGIGGPAVGRHLRLHPCTAVFGLYSEDQRAWWGPPHAGLVDEFANVQDGYGFLVEGVQYTTGLTASALPWTGAAEHKAIMERARFGASFIGLLRDHGEGRVTVDDGGQAVPWYALDDPVDVHNSHRALDALVRLHAAAGAQEILALAGGLPRWRLGDDIGEFASDLQRVPLRAGGFRLFSAHQMGTCRLGADPASSVGDPRGELHDTPGVWIGDGSALPTASGTNPMVSIMALAHRTAQALAERCGARIQTTAATPEVLSQ